MGSTEHGPGSQPIAAGDTVTFESAGPPWLRKMRSLLDLRHSARAKHAFRASSWSMAGYGSTLVLRFTSRLILAKLLTSSSPMGDVAVVSTILAGLEMIADLGIGINVVQHPRGREQAFLGTAFAIQIARGLLLWALASAAALPIASLYHDEQLGPLLLFGAVGVGLRGLSNPRIFTFNRALELRWPTLLSAGSEIFGFVVTVAWALVHPSAWALVGGVVASASFNTVASHLITRAPRPLWDRELASEIIRFGGWTILSTGSYFLSSRGENLMLKGPTPDVEFGSFAFASMLVTTPVIAITQLATQVLFPMMSAAVREGGEAADRIYRRSKIVFTVLASIISSGMILLGPTAIKILNLNSSYAALSWLVPFLGFRAALDVYTVPAGNVLFASGAMRFSATANLIRLVTLVAGLALVLHPYGLRGAIWVLVAAPMLSYSALMPGLRRYAPGTLWLEVQSLVAFLGVTAASALLAKHFY